MLGVAEQFEYILRDESMHVNRLVSTSLILSSWKIATSGPKSLLPK